MEAITEKTIRAFLRSKKQDPEAWLECPLSIFGDMTARKFADEMNTRYGDNTGWVSVLGTFKRIFE